MRAEMTEGQGSSEQHITGSREVATDAISRTVAVPSDTAGPADKVLKKTETNSPDQGGREDAGITDAFSVHAGSFISAARAKQA